MIFSFPRTCSVLVVAAFAGCTSTLATTVVVTPTSVGVNPNDFLGNVPCSPAPGAAKSYVVTLHDINDPTQDAKLNGSPIAVSCALPTTFEQVQELHRYSADIQVFDVPPSGVTPGVTKPAWTTSCGTDPDGNGLATVTNEMLTFIEGCKPLNAPGTAQTSIVIDTAALTTPVGCASAQGGIASINVTPTSASGPALPTVIVDCGQGTVTYDTGVTPNTAYSFFVRGFTSSGTASWATTCTATATTGVAITASCSPFSTVGSMGIDENALFTAAGIKCGGMSPGDASTYDVTFDAGTPSAVTATGVPCAQSAVVGPLAAGTHGGDVVVRNGAGARIGHAICFGTVTPGTVTTAPCTPD